MSKVKVADIVNTINKLAAFIENEQGVVAEKPIMEQEPALEPQIPVNPDAIAEEQEIPVVDELVVDATSDELIGDAEIGDVNIVEEPVAEDLPGDEEEEGVDDDVNFQVASDLVVLAKRVMKAKKELTAGQKRYVANKLLEASKKVALVDNNAIKQNLKDLQTDKASIAQKSKRVLRQVANWDALQAKGITPATQLGKLTVGDLAEILSSVSE